jgi:hypothetical protein
MAPKKDRGTEDDNVIRFDFRDELKKQRGKQRRKEWILGLGAFSIVFAGGMLALNWATSGLDLVYFVGAHTEVLAGGGDLFTAFRALRNDTPHLRRGWRHLLARG